MYILLLYASHSDRRNDTYASGNVGCGAPWSENTRALFTGTSTTPFVVFSFSFVLDSSSSSSFSSSSSPPPSPSLPPSPSPLSSLRPFLTRLPKLSISKHALTYKSGHFGKIDTGYRYKSNALSHRPLATSASISLDFRSMILHCVSGVSNTCSKQGARGPLCTLVRIIDSLVQKQPLSPRPFRHAISQLTKNLLLNLFQKCPRVLRESPN